MNGKALGKPRSEFGEWLDNQGISQQQLIKASGLGHGTINRLCVKDVEPSMRTKVLVERGLNDLGTSFFNII